ncbi:universal stress protein [Alteraurantiacibacter aquimixticola]|uniref:Universal stress protein n=1 Tax=Alteraurantiacibacter aquimixticola TaxID=2489173 RepID=A0A4T3F0X1_9SPHN|nr:universal stress protein [Alteraurantiacibacter aquimixticola]TIX50721.1 universal stress protein [Alteraurantiacibacter aquimixticola]
MYSRILIPVDLDEPSSWGKAVPVAQAMAASFGASITLCTVVPDSVARMEAQWSSLSYKALVDKAAARLLLLAGELGAEDAATEVGMGSIPGGILDIADQIDADLIVLSSHRPEMKDWLLGANAARVARHAKCSVLIVRD